MHILFSVDQKQALLEGVDAPSSTVLIDINPQDLPEAERKVLAETMRDGNKATGQIGWQSLKIVEPSLEGVRKALGKIVEGIRLQAEEKAARDRQEILDALAGRLEVYSVKYTPCPEDLKAEWAEFVRQYDERKEAESAEKSRLQKERDEEIRAKREAEERENKAVFDHYLALLPPEFLARREAGYATEIETTERIHACILSEAGVTESEEESTSSFRTTRQLSDAQFAAFQALQAKYPHAEVEAGFVYDYRPAEEGEESDSDGDFRHNYRKVARIVVRKGEFEAERIALC